MRHRDVRAILTRPVRVLRRRVRGLRVDGRLRIAGAPKSATTTAPAG